MAESTPTTGAPTGKSPFYAFVKDAQDLDILRQFAEKQNWPAANVHEGDITTATEFLAANRPPGLLIIEVPSAQAAPEQFNKLADVCDPDTKVLAVGNINEYSFFCWLTEIGIFGYLLRPLTVQAIETAWAKAVAPSAGGKSAKAPGKCIGVMGARGGVGATSVAVYMAALLAQDQDKKVALVDLDPQDGSVALLLDMEPSRGLREAFERPDRMDGLFLERVAQKSEHQFYVMSGEESMFERVHYHEQAAELFLKELQEKYDIIIFDLPRRAEPFFRGCLRACETVFLVAQPTLQALRDTMRLLDLFRDQLRIKPPMLVVNSVGHAPKHEMSSADFDKGINGKAEYHVPFAPDIFLTLSGTMEGLKNKQSPALKVLQQMAAMISPPPAAGDKDKDKDKTNKKGK